MNKWGSVIEVERKNRIKIAVAAFAYEKGLKETLTDAEFDELAKKINPAVSTAEDCTDPVRKKRYERLDKFFREDFKDYTGQWIYKHPELHIIQAIYDKIA